MADSPADMIFRACRDQLAPLVRADGGLLYIVAATSDEVHLHLSGTCAGCPGATMTRDRLIAPAVKALLPKAQLRVTTGWKVPEGARKVD
jgi:Fe-S cluster biogenesis protein NfuA